MGGVLRRRHHDRATVNDPATESEAKVNREFALLLAVPTALWVTAALLLVDHWWVRTGIRLSAMDPAAAQYLPPADAVFLAAVLAGCLWIGMAAPLCSGLSASPPCSDSPSR